MSREYETIRIGQRSTEVKDKSGGRVEIYVWTKFTRQTVKTIINNMTI